MSITVRFMDWNQPALEAAAEALLSQFTAEGLGDVCIIVPGSRAGRRLLELLVEKSQSCRDILIPPRILTPSSAADWLADSSVPLASPAARRLAWIAALKTADPQHLAQLMPAVPREDDLSAWAGLADLFQHLHQTLAAAMLGFADVAERAATLPDFNDTDRWQAAEAVRQQYLLRLQARGLADPHAVQMQAAREQPTTALGRVVLIGILEISLTLRLLLQTLAAHGQSVTSFVFAPPDLHNRFDDLGCIRPEAWSEARIPIDEDRIILTDRPVDQAASVIHALACHPGQFAAQDITIGLCDEELLSPLQQQMQSSSLQPRWAGGTPLSRSPLVRLLRSLAAYLEHQHFTDLASLVRHPDLERWLARNLTASRTGRAVEDWLSFMDRYYTDHLHGRLVGAWLGDHQTAKPMKDIYQAVQQLLAPFASLAQSPSQWAQPVADLLITIYGDESLLPHDPQHRTLIESCRAVREILAEYDRLPDSSDDPLLTGSQALRLILRDLEKLAIPPDDQPQAIELLGWLELPLDDAPFLLITGFNEGRVPESFAADPFLPNSLREFLHLEQCSSRRYARDAYALSLILASPRQVTLILGRRSVLDDPLFPSRLLFTGDPATVATRVDRLIARDPLPLPPLPTALKSGPVLDIQVPPRPILPLATPVTSMSVTSFRDYLACPYRFYLRHILHLRIEDDAALELDAPSFGNLAHDVLADFGRSAVKDAVDAAEIARFLSTRLDHLLLQRFGSEPLPAVRLQAELLRYRLSAFADWQAQHCADGWTIERVEITVDSSQAALIVDGQPMHLRGRIDRIDRNRNTGQRFVLDYKTGDTVENPHKTHRRGDQWVDLQLPLYRHLVAALGIDSPISLGYIILPRDTQNTGIAPADWSEADLTDADEIARSVIRDIRNEIFYPPAATPPRFDEYASICGVAQFASELDAAQEDAES